GAKYEDAVRAEFARIATTARERQSIVLNGLKDSDVALEYAMSDRHRLVLSTLATLGIVVTIGVAWSQSPVVTTVIVMPFLMALGAAMANHRLRRRLLRLFGQAE